VDNRKELHAGPAFYNEQIPDTVELAEFIVRDITHLELLTNPSFSFILWRKGI
jgi:hypothetical protein